MTRFLLIRHGDTDAVGRYHAGRAPGVHLNTGGRSQVERLVTALHDLPLAAIISSPLERTRQTAEPIAVDHGMELQIDPSFIEIGVGDWTGMTFVELASNERWRRYNSARAITGAPGGEMLIDVQHRAISALFKLRSQYPSGNLVVVSHGDVIRATLQYFLGMPIDYVLRFELSPARISIIEVHDETTRVIQVNGDTATLIA